MNTEIEQEQDDIAKDIRAAMEPEPVNEPAPEPEDQEPEQEEPEEEGDKAAEDRPRGPDGKFLAKDGEKAQDASNPAETEAPAPIRPPASWTPKAKALFASLDPVIQQEVLKREGESYKAIEDRGRQLKRYEPLEELLAPHRQKWQVAGIDETTALRQLLAASDWLERNPQEALAHLARQYGVNLPGQQQAQPHPTQAPAIQQASEYQTLQRELAALKAQMEEASKAPLLAEIEAFSKDPANLYFENVRDDMAVLLENGRAESLKDAYEMACYMNPDIRPLITQAVVSPDKAKAERARKAAGSVTGSPTQSGQAVPKSSGSIEDDLKAAMAEVMGQA